MKKTANKRRAATRSRRFIATYELVMPVFKAGDHLREAGLRASSVDPDQRAIDGLAASADDWSLGASLLLRLHLHMADRLAERRALGLDMDVSYEADTHSITVSGPVGALRPMLRDRLLRDYIVRAE